MRLYDEGINGSAYNWQRGLCDALAALTSENRGSVVWGHAYCNALQAHGHLYEWSQGHIHFDSGQSWYEPSGWVVRLLGESLQPVVLGHRVQCPTLQVKMRGGKAEEEVNTPAPVACASRDQAGRTLVLKEVNIRGGPVEASIDLGDVKVTALQAVTMASRHLAGEDTPARPDAISPRRQAVADPASRMTYTFPPVSFTVLRYFQGPGGHADGLLGNPQPASQEATP